MNRLSVFVAMFLFLSLACFAETASQDEVLQVAQTHTELFGNGVVSRIHAIQSASGAIGFVAELEPRGYILIPADKNLRPVIAYSFESDFDLAESRENFPLAIMKLDIENRIAGISRTPSSILRENRELWLKYTEKSPSFFAEHALSAIWGPYTDTRWNQDHPYNMFCPIDPETEVRCPIGCVVTAMGQIMNYWEWPPSVSFDSTDSYISTATTPTIFIDAPSANIDTIDFNAVGVHPDDTTMARMLFACGVSINMQYKDGGSSAMSHDVATALVGKFGYLSADGIMTSSPSFYTDLLLDIMNYRTPYMSMHSPEVGHGVVVDGYRESGEFHVNFGWGGTADAWYFLPDSLPHDLTIVDYGIVNITPPVITHRPVENLTADAVTGGHVMLRWSAPTLITESVHYFNVYRREIEVEDYTFIGTSHSLSYMDRYPRELTNFSYAVGAVYAHGVESRLQQAQVFSEIHDGWNRVIALPGNQTPMSVAPDGLGGFVAVGLLDNGSDATSDLCLLNMSVSGSVLWATNYGGSAFDCGYAILKTDDDCYLAVGTTESFGAGGRDVWLLKLDSVGDTLWTRTIGTADDEGAKDLTSLPSGGFAILGNLGESMSIWGVDASGTALWQKTYAGFVGNSIFENGGSLYIGGYYTLGPLGNRDAMLMKTDLSGDSVWTRAYGGANIDEVNQAVPSGDGGILLAGISRSFGMPIFNSIYIVKTTADGDTVFTRNFGGMKDFSAYSATQIEGGYVTAGAIVNSGNRDVYLLYLDEFGDTVKSHTYATAGTDQGYSILSLADSSLALAGRTYSEGSNDFWLMKIGGPVSPVLETVSPLPNKIDVAVHPNPFNSSVRISFDKIPSEAQIYDISGRIVARWSEGELDNFGEILWEPASSLVSGVYFIQVKTKSGNSAAAKIIYLK